MGKHKKILKAEKSKVKLRSKKEKDKLLPKGLNITNVTFKSKKINIQEQLKAADETQILSRRKLDVKALLNRLEHHNTKSRLQSLKELKEILTHHAPEDVITPLQPLLRGILSLTLDVEKIVRREANKVIHLMLSKIPAEKFSYSDIISSYLGCTMTHINPNIREDSLLLLDTISKCCFHVIIDHHTRIIPNLMDLISRMRSDGPRRLLNMSLSAKISNVKWATKILLSLANIFNGLIQESKDLCEKNDNNSHDYGTISRLFVNANLIANYAIDFNETKKDNKLSSRDFPKNVDQLVPLIFDCWTEGVARRDFDSNRLSEDETELLTAIVLLFQAIIKYIDDIDHRDEKTNRQTLMLQMKKKFQHQFVAKLFESMPYCKKGEMYEGDKIRQKRQSDFEGEQIVDRCDSQNLALCSIFIWFTKIHSADKFDQQTVECGMKLIDYVKEKLKKWTKLKNQSHIQLGNVLKVLFLEASDIWSKNNLPIKSILEIALDVHFHTTNVELQQQIFNLFESIAMDHTLMKLHSDDSFKLFVERLLPQLLDRSINDSAIRLLNNIVMRKLEWVKVYLEANKDAIIENAKTIEVAGSTDIHQSRLMICNLFYFTDGMTYY